MQDPKPPTTKPEGTKLFRLVVGGKVITLITSTVMRGGLGDEYNRRK